MSGKRETRSSSRKSFPPPEAKEKENHKARAKRHQSMGGATADGAPIPFRELVIKPPVDEMSPGKKKRRTALPRKSILKAKKDNDDQTQDYTVSAQTAPLPAVESQDFTTIMNFESHTTDDRRKSLARRVSFASHAHVRLFPKEAAKADSSSPAPATPASEDAPANADSPSSPSPPTAKGVSFEDVEPSPETGPSAGSSGGIRRRSSIANAGALLGHAVDDEDEDESSMELDDDTTNASIQQPPVEQSPGPTSGRLSLAASVTSQEDMDVTQAFGAIRQTQDDTAEHTASSKSSAASEFLVALGRNVPAANPKSRRGSEPTARDKAWDALESVTHGVNNESSDDDEDDMELADATGRIQALRRASVMTTGSAMDLDEEDMTGRIIQNGVGRLSFASQGTDMELDDDSRTDDEPLDENDVDADKTVNLSMMVSRMAELSQSSESAEDNGTLDPPRSEGIEVPPVLVNGSPAKAAVAHLSPRKTPSPLKRPASPSGPVSNAKRQALGDTPTKATLRAIQTPSKIFPSPLRQSPGRLLRNTPSKLGSPGRVRIDSPAFARTASSAVRAVKEAKEGHACERESRLQETATNSPRLKGRVSLAPLSQQMGSSQSQSVLQALEDISGIVEEDEQRDEIPVRQLAINEFLEMTGVTFMDGLAVKRRSTVGPGVLGSARGENFDNRGGNRPLEEYVTAAAVGIPQLEMYIWACQELKKNITTSQETVHVFNEQVEKSNPLLFREYLIANEDERPLMEGQLKIMKAHARLCAKEKWYQWRQGLVQDLQNTVAEHLTKLHNDYEFIQQTQAELGASLPELRARHAALAEQLDQERRNIQEIEGDNPEQLKELREGIAEQNAQIESFRGDLAEVATKEERVNSKLADIEDQRKQQMAVIARANQHCNMLRSCTRSEVFRLQEDYEAIQRVHLWKAVQLRPEESIFVYDSRVQVVLRPKQKSVAVDLQLLPGPNGEDKQMNRAMETLFRMMQGHVQSLSMQDNRQVVQLVGGTWTAATQILTEIRLLRQKYSISISPISSTDLDITVHIMLEAQRSKVDLKFSLSSNALMNWPTSVRTVGCTATLKYGNVELEDFVQAASERVEQASQNEFYGFLVDACREALASQD